MIDFIIRNLVSKQINQAQLFQSLDTVKTTTENKLQLKRNQGFSFCMVLKIQVDTMNMAVCMTCGPSMCSQTATDGKSSMPRSISSSRTSVFLQWHWCAEHSTLVFLDWPRAPRCPMVQGGTGAHRGTLGAGSWERLHNTTFTHTLITHAAATSYIRWVKDKLSPESLLQIGCFQLAGEKNVLPNASTLCFCLFPSHVTLWGSMRGGIIFTPL